MLGIPVQFLSALEGSVDDRGFSRTAMSDVKPEQPDEVQRVDGSIIFQLPCFH